MKIAPFWVGKRVLVSRLFFRHLTEFPGHVIHPALHKNRIQSEYSVYVRSTYSRKPNSKLTCEYYVHEP